MSRMATLGVVLFLKLSRDNSLSSVSDALKGSIDRPSPLVAGWSVGEVSRTGADGLDILMSRSTASERQVNEKGGDEIYRPTVGRHLHG